MGGQALGQMRNMWPGQNNRHFQVLFDHLSDPVNLAKRRRGTPNQYQVWALHHDPWQGDLQTDLQLRKLFFEKGDQTGQVIRREIVYAGALKAIALKIRGMKEGEKCQFQMCLPILYWVRAAGQASSVVSLSGVNRGTGWVCRAVRIKLKQSWFLW